MGNPYHILFTIILVQLVFFSHGQILFQSEDSSLCKVFNINCNQGHGVETIPFRYYQHNQNEIPMTNVLKYRTNETDELPLTVKAYKSLLKLKSWFNDWKGHLTLNEEQVQDLKQKLQALELVYMKNLNLTQHILKDDIKCKKCRKPTKLDKRITAQSNSVSEEDDDPPPDPESRQEFLGIVQSGLNLFGVLPFLLANLAMTFVTFSFGIFGLAGGSRLQELHQEQLNALSGLAGVPIEVVTPLRDQDVPDTPDGDPARIGLSLFDPNYQSASHVMTKTWQDVQEFMHEMKTKSLLENSFLIIPLVLFWTALIVFSSIFGFSGITLLLIMAIAPVIYFAKLETIDLHRFGRQSVPIDSGENSLERNIKFATEGLVSAIRHYEN